MIRISISKSFLTLALCWAYLASAAQQVPPTEEFEVEGLKVILRQSVKGTVSARLFVQGGAANYPKEKEGIEALALELAMGSGPEGMSKQEFLAATDAIGAQLSASTDYDYANMSLNCIKMYWEDSWKLFSESVLNPAFRAEDFKILQEQLITQAKQRESNPDAYLRQLSMAKTYAGTEYAKIPSGSAESLAAITLEEVKNYYRGVVTRANTFLVVVGDISVDDLRSKVASSLAKLPMGSENVIKPSLNAIEPGVYVEDRPIETNYILGRFSAPMKGTEESVYNSLAFSILYDRFFEELRTKRSLSYAPAAVSTGDIRYPSNMVYISTTDPSTSLDVMLEELNQVKKEGFTAKELSGEKQGFITRHYMGQENNSSISMSLGINEINGGWEKADAFTERVQAATLEDLNAVVRKYGDDIFWTYLGVETMVKPEDFGQPEKLTPIKE